ncbi:TetR family transcriptional regulator [Mycobacterium sp. Aquia_213]|uniref:TetR family transcriptional regulator n=1 Tax=Mycobacterium sp. Aquia_213 TaxID=2991728 RepID=UPI003B63FCB8
MTDFDGAHGETGRRDARILDAVVQILEMKGYDAVQLREVARRSQTSLTTIYKRYSNRDELIAAAVQMWMDEHRFAKLWGQSHEVDESLYGGLMRVLRTIFLPWEEHPGMLTAYFRARAAPGGQQIVRHGLDMAVPKFFEVLRDVDDSFIADLDSIISTLVYGLLGRFTAGEIAVTDILPTLDRAVWRLTSGYETQHQHAADQRPTNSEFQSQ